MWHGIGKVMIKDKKVKGKKVKNEKEEEYTTNNSPPEVCAWAQTIRYKSGISAADYALLMILKPSKLFQDESSKIRND